MDHASATPVDARVGAHMRKIEGKLSGNPDALHKEGREAKETLEDARKIIAMILRAHTDEIIFTSSATEANNLAIKGVFSKLLSELRKVGKKPHIITTSIEHKSVLEVAKHVGFIGADISYIGPDEKGIINPKDIYKAIRPETILVSIMYANNEIGTIEPISEIAKSIRKAKKDLQMIVPGTPYFHTDAAQAANYCELNVLKLGIDMMTLSSPKIYGEAGIGALYIRRRIQISPIVFGGGQEFGLRSGRELPRLASGFAKALEITEKEKQKESVRLIRLRDYFFKNIFKALPDVTINGSQTDRLPNNVNICIPNLDAEFAVYQLDERGVACSSASTCVNLSADSISYVVEVINPGKNCAGSSLRFSLGRSTTKKDIEDCLKALKEVILRQRNKWNKSRSRFWIIHIPTLNRRFTR
jgi:cysteine desulfurase